jgi:MOSC domain-containing protein YiiM
MKLIAVSVGQPRVASWRGKLVETGIFKTPLNGPVTVRRLNLDGDRQADLSVHGGAEKAVYGYPAEHYAFWRAELGEGQPWGAFGENLTTAGLDEESLHIGDRLRIGAAELVVTQPRLPCFKLGVRFGRPDMVKRFLASGRTGFYFAVQREGQVAAHDPIAIIERDPRAVTVADITRIATVNKDDLATLRRALAVPALAESWRIYFADVLAAAGDNEAPIGG